jgi:hypothetical protein
MKEGNFDLYPSTQAMGTQVHIVNFLIDISGSMDRNIHLFAGETRFQRVIFICQVLIACFPGATFNYYLINSREQGKGLVAANLAEVETRFKDRARVANTSDIAARINNILQQIKRYATAEMKTLLFVFSDGDDTASPAAIKKLNQSQMKDLRGKLYTTVVYFDKVIPIPDAYYFDGQQKYAKKEDLRSAVRQYVNEMLLVTLPAVHEQEMVEVDLR